jgi:hypothetical protein
VSEPWLASTSVDCVLALTGKIIWVRKDKLNIQLSAITMVNNEQSYCFGMRLNFAPSLDSKVVQAEVETSGDLGMLYVNQR